METTRQQKFSKLILKELSDIFVKDGKSFFGKSFVTITQVKTTSDLSLVRVHLSVMGTKEPKTAIDQANDHAKELRGALGLRIKNQVRHIPSLEFFLDESLEYADKIERLLKEANQPPNQSK